MNDVQSLIDRQLGIYCRLNYDNVLKRLVVRSEESFYGLAVGGAADPVADQDPPIFACRFAEMRGREHILALANEDGRVAIQNTSKLYAASSLESFQCHNNAVFDLAWMPGSMNFVTVSGDHTACLWDIAEGAPKRVLMFSSHTRSVKTAVFRPTESSVFATGARDGHILVWDIRASCQPAVVLKPDNCLMNCHSSFTPKTPGSHGKRPRLDNQRAISITGLVFQDDLTLLSCGECDGNIKAWDLRKNYSVYKREPLPKHSIPYCGSSTRNGYTNLVVDEARVRLYASCMDSVIYCFNVSTYSALPERRYVGHESGTFYIKSGLSPDGRYLVSGSSDKSAYVWNVREQLPLVRLAGHRAEVTCAAWARAGDALVTCSDDARHHIWRIGRERDARPDPDYELELRGRAEPVAREVAAPPPWGRGAASPKPPKRRAASPPGSGAKRARPSPAASTTPRASKRCLAELLQAAAEASPPKRARPPSPRSPRRLAVAVSPGKVAVLDVTAGLPDWVRCGEAPHLRLMSPAKRKPAAPDWLTRIARERRAGAPAAPPGAPADADSPAASDAPPARRSSVSERTPRAPKKGRRTLLTYFSVAGKN